MTDYSTAKKEIRLRQREICWGVGLANGEAGGDYTYSLIECNEALQREGLPMIPDKEEWDLVMHGPEPTDPAERLLKQLTEIELTRIALAAKRTISMHGSMGLTYTGGTRRHLGRSGSPRHQACARQTWDAGKLSGLGGEAGMNEEDDKIAGIAAANLVANRGHERRLG